MSEFKLTIGTRGSALALAQTGLVRDALIARWPGLIVETERIVTTGDRLLDQPLTDVGGKGVFVAEIEQALHDGRIDLAVHSAKDLPTDLPDSLVLAAYPRRADARDVLVSPHGKLASLPAGARVGTSSPRRVCQVVAARPDVTPVLIRGNVDTRLEKLAAGGYEAIVLAAAGLIRLGREDMVTEWFSTETMVPATGQGSLAIQARRNDERTRTLVGALGDPATAAAVSAERAFLRRLGAGCSAPAGAYASIEGDCLEIVGMIGSVAGRMVRADHRGAVSEAERIGTELADQLLEAGGRHFLDAAEHAGAWAG